MAPRSGVRVIAGSARGRRLATPPGSTTRPMTDRVRESLFSALESRGGIAGARVLDLYAGSGVLAIEALSRGAERALLIERAPAAAGICRDNVARAGFDARATVEAGDVPLVLARTQPPAPFDLVFVDPPYDDPDDVVAEVLGTVARSWAAPGATLVVHRRGHIPPIPDDWRVGWERRFGDTLLALVQAHP
jgi:16S rRNA (guanine966-N2)-methyltransferase